jgi:hypothetical protein
MNLNNFGEMKEKIKGNLDSDGYDVLIPTFDVVFMLFVLQNADCSLKEIVMTMLRSSIGKLEMVDKKAIRQILDAGD